MKRMLILAAIVSIYVTSACAETVCLKTKLIYDGNEYKRVEDICTSGELVEVPRDSAGMRRALETDASKENKAKRNKARWEEFLSTMDDKPED
ncbi:hypothetical protein BDE40_1463 [Litoreibacter halocynthiae]|uniref:Uncharacterized protein n=1 Tax=Litoreibacter halocynthiae TaxID=1242689 RepID=A0A4R7LGB9_9RHOB|nr:hypothetical protein [Litoreibacter halocynthiae]TDT74747.1 hypothetical protein BDE40_1463 [Litoreibacter halocynthiae]